MVGHRQQHQKEPAGAGVPRLIAEMDGSMVPVVETAASLAEEAPMDHRKTRKLSRSMFLASGSWKSGSPTKIVVWYPTTAARRRQSSDRVRTPTFSVKGEFS
jgi:hypothetical protein